MNAVVSHENELLLNTVQCFLKDEIYPHEDAVDRSGEVPLELGRQIEARAKEVGLFAANLPEAVGGGGLNYTSSSIVEREYGKTTHALQSWIARPTELLLACEEMYAGVPGRGAADASYHTALVIENCNLKEEGRQVD